MKSNHGKAMKMITAAFFLAAAYVLPFLTGQILPVPLLVIPAERLLTKNGYDPGEQT